MTKNTTNKEKINMITLYIGLFISTIFNFVPIASAQIFGGLFFLVLLIAAYIYRYGSEDRTLQNSHARYIIKTIWIFSLFLFIGIILAGLFSDNTALQNTIDNAKNGIITSEAELENIFGRYIQENIFIFLPTLGPSFLYFIYRLYKGCIQVKNNAPITNLKNWF